MLHFAKRCLASLAAAVAIGTTAAVTATYHIYDGIQPAQTACNIPWTSINTITAYAYLGTNLKCGDCVKITNTRTSASIVVHVVDMGGNIFDLSQQAFNSIDTDKQGYLDGHMDITYQKTACDGSSSAAATTATPITTATSVVTTTAAAPSSGVPASTTRVPTTTTKPVTTAATSSSRVPASSSASSVTPSTTTPSTSKAVKRARHPQTTFNWTALNAASGNTPLATVKAAAEASRNVTRVLPALIEPVRARKH